MDLTSIDFPDIRWLHGVFYCNSSGSGRDKKYHPWSGVKTDLGEIEEKAWCQIAEALINRKGESALLKSLIEWETNHNYAHASKEVVRKEALQLHVARLFDNPLWVHFVPFNRQYRPEVLETAHLVTVAIPVADMDEVYARIEAAMGITITPENQSNADNIYNIVLYGTATGTGDWFPGADVPFISADGFCSPVGANWESIVTSEFGYRRDPFTGETRGHSGMDLAVPTGTPVRAALPGTVTVSQYNAGGYGYYVMIDHGNGLSTLYGHNSRLLAQVGQTVEAGDIIALSGSTGRSTGPHLHFEVRVNGKQTDPRAYLPTAGG